jgi:hypothetical protein
MILVILIFDAICVINLLQGAHTRVQEGRVHNKLERTHL